MSRLDNARVNPGSRPRCKLMMAGNEVGVEMGFDDVPDFQAVRLRFFEVDVDVALRIDHCSISAGTDQVRSMSKTAEVELTEIHGMRL